MIRIFELSGDVHDQMRTRSQSLAPSLIVKVVPAVVAKAKRELTKKEGEILNK